jgi:mRNA interferase RelE/StbE
VYKVEYAGSVARDLKGLAAPVRAKALEICEKVLAADPRQGVPLHGPYKGLWKCRLGDHRIVYKIEGQRLVIFVLRIRHRRDAYRGIVL